MAESSFHIPARPTRSYPYSGGVEYEGETRFRLAPDSDCSTDQLATLVEEILEDGPYRYGDFLDLPMPLYLVRDNETGDVFRVSVRDGRIRFHVLPETDSPGLRNLYDRIDTRTPESWRITCHTSN